MADDERSEWEDEDTKAKLLAALKAEEMQAVGYETSSEVTKHTEALDRYFGKPYGDEVQGRSQITTREIYETVAWTLPDILDIFVAGGRICELEADDPEAEKDADVRADYLNYVLMKDNEGVLVLHDFIFDTLMHPRGYVDVEWDAEPSYGGWEEYSGLTEAQVEAMINDPATEIDEQSVVAQPTDPSEAYPDGLAYGLKARKRLRDGCCRIENVPPEDMFVAGRATSMKQARYKGRLLRWRRSVWKSHFPSKREEIEAHDASNEASTIDTDERRSARFNDQQASYGEWATAANKAAEELIGRKEYIWYAEPDSEDEAVLLRVYRLGDEILQVDEVDDDPFASATGHRIPHRLQGLSIPEILGDLQKLKTVLTRELVNGTMAANVPRVAADKQKTNLDDLLNLAHGAVIRTDGPPGDALLPFQMNDLSASTLKALEWTNQIIEQRAGVTRHAQGMDPDSLNHTAKGIQLIQQAANAVKRLLARLVAVGVEEMMTKIDRTVMRNQKSERLVKLGKEWQPVDPRSWSPSMRVTVSVGLGTGAKDVQLQFLEMIAQKQVAWVGTYGMQTPVVTPQHLHNTVTEMLRVMGYQTADKFFGEPVVQNPQTGQFEPFVPQPPPSPDQQKIQAQIQEGQARLQMDGMKAQFTAQLDAQKMQSDAQIKQLEMDAKASSDARKADQDYAIAQMKAQAEIAVMREKAMLEAQTAADKLAFEMQMAREKFEFEKQMAREKLAIDRQAAKAGGKANGSAANMSDQKIGGSVGA